MTSQLTASLNTWPSPFGPDEPVLPESSRVTDGPVPRFGDFPMWDLTAAGVAPNVSAAGAQLRFDGMDPAWAATAKTIAMAMLQPTHPSVRAAGIFRSNRPSKIKTISSNLRELRLLAGWAGSTGRPHDLSTWSEVDCRSYLAHVADTRAASAVHSVNDLLRLLADYGPLLPHGGLRNDLAPAFSGRTSSGIATPVIPPHVFWPLVRACWTYLNVFAAELVSARDELTELDTLAPPQNPNAGALDRALDSWLTSPNGFVPLHIVDMGRGLRGTINWTGLRLHTVGRQRVAYFEGSPGLHRRQRVLDAIENGLPTRYGVTNLQPNSVARSDGATGPWADGFDHTMVKQELTQVRNAAYIFVSIMTMMRDSEVQGIAGNSVTNHYGAPAVESRIHKGQSGAGRLQRWWIAPPVQRALQVAEDVALDPQRLFGTVRTGVRRKMVGFDQHEQIKAFVGWVNAHADQTGLEPIADIPLAPHMFRRTMAVITANEPDGEIALGITLKHNAIRALANVTTAGYGAPTPEWAKDFEHEAQEATAAELVSDWARHSQGETFVRGPGRSTFMEGLDEVSDRAKTDVAIGDERMLRNLLRDEFATIRLGTLNHCLGDPAKAVCLEKATAAVKAGGPIASMCQPATCRNSVITDKHLPVWQHEEDELLRKLKDKRMAPVHRLRLETQLADVRKITRQEPK